MLFFTIYQSFKLIGVFGICYSCYLSLLRARTFPDLITLRQTHKYPLNLQSQTFLNSLFPKPWMTKNEQNLLYHYLDQAKVYFEFGSGGSTYQALKRNLKIFSVESDISWHRQIRKDLINFTNIINSFYQEHRINSIFSPEITFLTVDLHSKPNSLGWPGKDSTFEDCLRYMRAYNHTKYNADLILIDGRFRVACALNVAKEINTNVIVIWHDFLTRDFYHIALNYFEIIDSADNIVALKVRQNYFDLNILEKYEKLPN